MYMKKGERRREDTGKADFSPASNPGWANRGHTNWAPPICHTGVFRVVPPVRPIANTSLAAMFQHYLHGAMHGELLDPRRQREYEERDFILWRRNLRRRELA
jgi:hypothetical protein